MKTKLVIIIIVFISTFVISSCEKNINEDNTISSLSSIKDGKILSGKITNYSGTGIDKLKLYSEDSYENNGVWESEITVIAEGSVSPDGQFSLTLSTPSKLINIQDFLGGDFVGEISDKTAFVFNDDFLGAITAYKGNEEIGYVFRGNTDVFDDWGEPPYTISLFIYSDRKTIIKGQDKSSDYSYDFTLYKGWNEVVRKLLKSSSNSTVIVSNIITDDMLWKFSSEDN